MSAAAALQNPKSNGRLWSVAVAFAVFLHVGGAVAALLTLQGELDDEASGAPAIEISLEPAAPRDAEAADLPPGPLADEAAAAAPSVAASEAKETNEERITHAEAEEAELAHTVKPDKPIEEEKTHQAQPVVSAESHRRREQYRAPAVPGATPGAYSAPAVSAAGAVPPVTPAMAGPAGTVAAAESLATAV